MAEKDQRKQAWVQMKIFKLGQQVLTPIKPDYTEAVWGLWRSTNTHNAHMHFGVLF